MHDHAATNEPLLLSQRSNRLARALLELQPSGTVTVVCCPSHHIDRRVATLAAKKARLACLVVEPERLEALPRGVNPSVVLTCEDGTEAWLRSNRRGLVIGQGEGVRWWQAVELLYSAAPIVAESEESCNSAVTAAAVVGVAR